MKNQIIKTGINIIAIFIVMIAIGVSVLAQSTMIVDRGLPMANLNDAAGEFRSNATMGVTYNYYFFGDDFIVPQPSGSGNFRIDTIRVWFVGGPANNDSDLANDSFLGDQSLGNLSLWVGTDDNVLTKMAQARFQTGRDATNNPKVVATRVQYAGDSEALDFENLPLQCSNGCVNPPVGYSTIVRIDFKNLNLTYPAGTLVRFGIFTDRGGAHPHTSNFGYSGTTSDSADGWVHTFMFQNGTAYLHYSWGNLGSIFFNKPMDMNVQVFATLVNKPRRGNH